MDRKLHWNDEDIHIIDMALTCPFCGKLRELKGIKNENS